MNGDGRPDLVATSQNSSSVSILLGIGDGTFTAKVDYPTGDSPDSIALGDLNGDGKLDIVTSNSRGYTYSGTVSVLLGTGDGKFANEVDYPLGENPQGIGLGDLNGDGKMDVVAANAGSDDYWSVSVLLAKGDGTFADRVDYTSGPGPSSVTLGDLNGDGKLDIIMPNSTVMRVDTVSVLLGKGDGTFADKVDYGTGDFPTAVALSDMNGDGWVDIVTTNLDWDAGTVSVLLGNGDGTFAAKLDYLGGGRSLALGDLNGDGRLDIVTTGDNSISVLLSSCR